MEALDFMFRIGVILAVYNFIWWLIMLGFGIIRNKNKRQRFEEYLIKFIRYIFLADVIFLFGLQRANGELNFFIYLLCGLIFLLYLVGKIQTKQARNSFFTMKGNVNIPGVKNMLKKIRPIFDIRYEIGVVTIVIITYILFFFYPFITENTISIWFLNTIKGIEEAPIFGFIFKVIGFFFMLSVIFKALNGLFNIFTPKRTRKNHENHFDDFDELN